MSIGCDKPQTWFSGPQGSFQRLDKDAVYVVPCLVGGNGKSCFVQHFVETGGIDRERLLQLKTGDRRIFIYRGPVNFKSRLAALDIKALPFCSVKRYFGMRQLFDDIVENAGIDRDVSRRFYGRRSLADKTYFEICCCYRQPAVFSGELDVGEDRHGVLLFDDRVRQIKKMSEVLL